MRSTKSIIPYLYVSVKRKCYRGPKTRRRTRVKVDHSCTRKIVSFVAMYGRKRNKRFHRAGQCFLEKTPSWEVWSMKLAPEHLHKGFARLRYDERFRHVCIVCGGRKKPVSSSVCDLPQAYEQIEPPQATEDLGWMIALSSEITGHRTVTINRDLPGMPFLGGVPGARLCLQGPYQVVTRAEVFQWISPLLQLVWVRVGDAIWKTPGTCIGNPMGRLALAAYTGGQEIGLDARWKRGELKHPGWAKVAREGWTREECVATGKYADDWNGDSLAACNPCTDAVCDEVYDKPFDPPGDRRKFLDTRKVFVCREGQRPKLVLRPVLKYQKTLEGVQREWEVHGAAPWWNAYTPGTLAGIVQGYLMRYRVIIPQERPRLKAMGLMLLEYILRGYRLRTLELALALTPWSAERRELLHRLREVRRSRIRTEGHDWFETRQDHVTTVDFIKSHGRLPGTYAPDFSLGSKDTDTKNCRHKPGRARNHNTTATTTEPSPASQGKPRPTHTTKPFTRHTKPRTKPLRHPLREGAKSPPPLRRQQSQSRSTLLSRCTPVP